MGVNRLRHGVFGLIDLAYVDMKSCFGFRCDGGLFLHARRGKRHRWEVHWRDAFDFGHLFSQFIIGRLGRLCRADLRFRLILAQFDAENGFWTGCHNGLFLDGLCREGHWRQCHWRNRFDLGHLLGQFLFCDTRTMRWSSIVTGICMVTRSTMCSSSQRACCVRMRGRGRRWGCRWGGRSNTRNR